MNQSTGMLQQMVARIERLEDEKKTIADDIKQVYAEAKSQGLDVKILRKVIAKRKKSAADRQEEESMIDVYMVALGAPGDGVHSFTRADGVEVTLKRATAPHDPVTGEIAETSTIKGKKPRQVIVDDIQEAGPAPAPDGRGETSAASDAPADPIELPPTEVPPDSAAKAADDDVPQPTSAADPFPEMPDFLHRQAPAAVEYLAAG